MHSSGRLRDTTTAKLPCATSEKRLRKMKPQGIDPDRIYFAGVSAGGFIGLHLAYVDDESEIPPQVDQEAPGMGGGMEGESGNPGYSSTVAGVVNIAGALKTVDYLSPGDRPWYPFTAPTMVRYRLVRA